MCGLAKWTKQGGRFRQEPKESAVPFAASTVGVSLYAQAAAIDVGQTGLPLAMSNGRANTFPATPVTPATVTRVYGYRLTATTVRAPSVWTGGIVTRLD